MKNNIVTTTLISLGLASSWSVLATPIESTIDEQILITGNRSQQEQFLALSANQVITKEQIDIIQPLNITDLLDQVAGISVTKQGGAGQISSVFMRGTNSGHTLILVDGIRIGSATLGTTNFAAISIAQIERIEIVKGPRAALWGSDAIGGVIQIFTKKLNSGEGNISLGFGSHGLLKTDASLGLGNEKHSLTLTVSGEQSSGFNAYQTTESLFDINEPDKDGYDRQSFSLVGQSIINDNFSLSLTSRLEQGNAEFDASYPDSPCWDDATKACPSFFANEQDHDNYSIKVSGQYQKDIMLSELSISTNQDQGKSFGNGIDKADADKIKTKRDQFSFINHFTFNEKTSVALGLDWYTEHVSTNTDKDPWTEGFQSWEVDKRDVSAIFLQVNHQIGALMFEGAIRRDDIDKLGEEVSYNASLGYQFSPTLLMSVNHGTGFKAPTFNDLYWPGSGNANLKPEDSTSNEFLIRGQFELGQFELSFFDSEIENLIAWAPNELGVWQPSNVNQADIQGIELSVSADWRGFNNQLAFTYLKTEDKSTGEPLLRRPELSANYTLGYHWEKFNFNTTLSYRDESKDASPEPLSDYWLLDISLTYQASESILIVTKINNIFDKRYENVANYIADGSNYQITASYSF